MERDVREAFSQLKFDLRDHINKTKQDILSEIRSTSQATDKESKSDLTKWEIGRRIVCAAMRNKDGRIITGARHFDGVMITAINFSKDDWSDHEGITQGFIDQRGVFLTRTEAWPIAHAAGQIIRRVGSDTTNGGTLYSENLY